MPSFSRKDAPAAGTQCCVTVAVVAGDLFAHGTECRHYWNAASTSGRRSGFYRRGLGVVSSARPAARCRACSNVSMFARRRPPGSAERALRWPRVPLCVRQAPCEGVVALSNVVDIWCWSYATSSFQLGEARRVVADPPGVGVVAQAREHVDAAGHHVARRVLPHFCSPRTRAGCRGRDAARLGRRWSWSTASATAVRNEVGRYIS